MKYLTDEEYLDSEKYWKDNFKIEFVKLNSDKTEWWVS